MIKKTMKIFQILLVILATITLAGCKDKEKKIPDSFENAHRYENIYEVFVRSYADSNNDGIGDFKGLEQKLSYIKDLGFTAIWLMPINSSPSYHGYDVTDYYNVNSDYGTLADFKSLTKTAKSLGIDIYMDLVVNHSSKEHPWFKKAVNGETPYKDYYLFSNSSSNSYWHGTGKGNYYYGYFSDSMPDLNLKNQEVIEEIKKISAFWINNGVSGFRLDGALHYLRPDEYNSKAAIYTNAVTIIKDLEDYCKTLNPSFHMIVEAWDKYLGYASTFRAGVSPIDFDTAELILSTALSETYKGFFYQMDSMYKEYARYDSSYCPTPFLLNHDMDRLASKAGFSNNPTNQRFAAEILLCLPGSPIVYYGEEIGMKGIRAGGANGQYDETVRLPYVSGDETETSWTRDYNNYNNITSAKDQLEDTTSLINTYKCLLNLRNNNIALKYGNHFEEVTTNKNSSLICYTRTVTYNNKTQTILVIHNLSSSSQVLPDVSGKLLYATDQATTLDTLERLPGKSTLIIDITKGYIK